MSHISIENLYLELKKGIVHNSYIFYGIDEKQIKEAIEAIIDKVLDGPLKDLNLFKFDGMNFDFQSFKENAENIPFMSEKKVMVLYRTEALRTKSKEAGKGNAKKESKELMDYLKNPPNHCVIIAYYVFNDKREKNKALDNMKSDICLIKVEELKGDRLYRKVADIFREKGRDIGKIELTYFCENSSKDLNIIENDVDKLISYCMDRTITKDDISKLLNISHTDDVFDLVDAICQGKIEKAISLMNELIFKGTNEINILYMIERQFDLLLKGKVAVNNRQGAEEFEKLHGVNFYVGKRIMEQSRRFSEKKLKECIKICADVDGILKSKSVNAKMELEMLLVKSAQIKN